MRMFASSLAIMMRLNDGLHMIERLQTYQSLMRTVIFNAIVANNACIVWVFEYFLDCAFSDRLLRNFGGCPSI